MNELLHGVVGVMMSPQGEVLLIPPQLDDNAGKEEMVVDVQEQMVPVAGWECPAGLVDLRDIAVEQEGVDRRVGAIMRECAEEFGVILSPRQIVLIQETMIVRQKRKEWSDPVDILGWVAIASLTDEQVHAGRLMGAKFASELGGERIRARDEATFRMLQEYQQSLVVSLVMDTEEVLSV